MRSDKLWVTSLPAMAWDGHLMDHRRRRLAIGSWIEDYNDNHPHSGLKMRSPREFIAAETATA
nr:integrase core domain-containing protein [Paracoccus litorisediminis]